MPRPSLAIAPTLLLLAACAGTEPRPRVPDADTQAALAAKGKPGCLYPSDVRTWHNSNDGALFVDAGRRKYRVDLWGECRDSLGVTLAFKGDAITGRVCGNPGDAVMTSSRELCKIRDVRQIDDDTYALATGTRRPGAAAADDTGDEPR